MIINGDCHIEMGKMEPNSIDFVVTDPPYGLNFMGKQWDSAVPNVDIWKEALRVCKPGSMLAAFGGSRTHHHLMIALEQAGWEIRDVIMWLYGSGFPKSHNKFGLEGFGTALKPAYEPIIIAMKPLEGTYKQNAEKWGVGGINIEDCRIETNEKCQSSGSSIRGDSLGKYGDGLNNSGRFESHSKGRWPANLILDEEAAIELDALTGILKSGKPGIRRKEHHSYSLNKLNITGEIESGIGDSGGASRFFYCAKASSKERGEGNNHPTVKPISLMKYIINLLAPPGDPILLDPFAGSGSTLLAAKELGIRSIGIELNEEYCDIARKRTINDHDI